MLTFEQKNLIGINFVFDKLKLSQSGRRRLKNMTPFTQAESKEWKEEIENVSRIVDSLNEYRGDWEKIACKIAAIKDLIPTFNKGAIRSFTEIELFEIKCFALNAMAIRAMFLPVAQKIGLSDTDIKSLQNIIDILDPLCNKSASFEIYSVYSDNLQEIRSNKLKLEKMLRECPDNMQFMAERTQLAADEKAEEEKILVMLTNEINMYINLLIETAFMIGKIDLLIAKAFLATEWDLARPELSDRIYFEDMINPYIADSLEQKGKAFTPVTIELNKGATVISGANMSGKSVVLKSIALNIYLVSLGFFAFAEVAEIMLMDEIISISEDLEDSSRGLSSFGGEINRLNEAVEAVNNGFVLLLMDEFARGTNPVEGEIIARNVVKYFDNKDVICVMTTHFSNVADYANAHYQVVGLSECDKDISVSSIEDLMDYSLVKVAPSHPVSADAIKICRMLHLDRDILDLIDEDKINCNIK